MRVGRGRLLHAEYIRSPKPNMFARMVDYRAKIMRRYQGISLAQIAIVMGEGRLKEFDDPANGFFLGLRTIYLDQIRKETGMLSYDAAVDFYSTTEVGRGVRERGREEGHLEGSAKAVMTMLRGRLGADPRIPAVAWRIVRSPDIEAHVLALPSLGSLDDLPAELLSDS